jgi:hypothetical protein
MPFMSLRFVVIELFNSSYTFHDSRWQPQDGLTAQVVVKEKQPGRFTVEIQDLPPYLFSREEADSLWQLLNQVEIVTPWQGEVGKDGMVSELIIQGGMSHIRFSWWGNVPAEWQSIGAVFDYVMAIAQKMQFS